MKFLARKRRQAPTIIIISLIDILIVLLIFLMVTTTFKQQPAIRLALPESKQTRIGRGDPTIVVTIAKDAPHFFLGGNRPVTLDKLKQELAAAAKQPNASLSLRADTGAPFGIVIKVVDAANEAGIKVADAFIKSAGKP